MPRRGFTVLELLVTLAIIAILSALILPLASQARDAARRLACENNLIQLSLGIQNYEVAHGVLPPGTVDTKDPVHSRRQGYHHSWLVQLLPFVDLAVLAEQISPSASIYENGNASVTTRRGMVFHCPSAKNVVATVGTTNYAACHHHLEAPISTTNRGAFFLNSSVRSEAISDGRSNTIFLGEKFVVAGDLGWASGTKASLRNTGTAINADPEPVGPNDTLYVGGFQSRHGHGANFAFGDGSVRFISATIDMNLYRQLGNRNDETLMLESF